MKHADKWSRWVQEGERVKAAMEYVNGAKSSGFGPDSTADTTPPPVTCPRCGDTVKADAVARHGMLHRAIDASFR